jgi:hypothetical protein
LTHPIIHSPPPTVGGSVGGGVIAMVGTGVVGVEVGAKVVGEEDGISVTSPVGPAEGVLDGKKVGVKDGRADGTLEGW